ncbi:hypothetical protein ACWIGW_46060, partial [Nocardia brasiliensis]
MNSIIGNLGAFRIAVSCASRWLLPVSTELVDISHHYANIDLHLEAWSVSDGQHGGSASVPASAARVSAIALRSMSMLL